MATVQSLSGTGALRLAAETLAQIAEVLYSRTDLGSIFRNINPSCLHAVHSAGLFLGGRDASCPPAFIA